MKKEGRKPFIKDGSPSPDEYSKSKTRILFILKDANFGINDEDKEIGNFDDSSYDQRKDLEKNPHVWWNRVRNWCAFLLNPRIEWDEVKKKDVAESLAPFSFMQLKKNAGGGSVNAGTLWDVAKEDSLEIKEQIAIYHPDFIVCCGVGEIVYKIIFSGRSPLNYTPHGVGYWKVNREDDSNRKYTYVIDYCHPSARFGKKIEGVVAFGLVNSINHLIKKRYF
ncbi:MAG: hypothetical protein VST71_09465 [Nitrospirota bacterium]|nr:hypothetical protein [Nitrospirota bacterium]